MTQRFYYSEIPLSDTLELGLVGYMYPDWYKGDRHISVKRLKNDQSGKDITVISFWSNDAADTRAPDEFMIMQTAEAKAFFTEILSRLDSGFYYHGQTNDVEIKAEPTQEI